MISRSNILKINVLIAEVAKKIMSYPQVESVYLMSGVYDLNVVVKGKTLKDIAWFADLWCKTFEWMCRRR